MHFHRDRMTAKGGPDGGDGGRGGHIILKGNRNLWTLLHLRYRKNVLADHGENGTGQNKTGADGQDVILEVPLGTIAKDLETGEKEVEILEHGEEVILMEGGMGGLGNQHFATSTNQAPRYAQPGMPGKEGWKVLELKVIADVGLVGFPNAGKSTLLSVVSAAKPKIASYAFTTLTPNLGIVGYRDNKSFIMADIPGIIEDAHLGKGLGLRFLRHIERNAVLLFVIPADADDVRASYNILLNELTQHNPELIDKPRVIGLSKSDLIDDEIKEWIIPTLPENIPYIFFSAVTQTGLQELKDALYKQLVS